MGLMIYREMLSEGVASPRPYKSRVPEGVFLPDFLNTTFESTFFEGFFAKKHQKNGLIYIIA